MKTRENWDLLWDFMKTSQNVGVYGSNLNLNNFIKYQKEHDKMNSLLSVLLDKLEGNDDKNT